MSKYLDFIGKQISQSEQNGSSNTDIELSEESGVISKVKEHGLKVAGGLVVVAGSVLAYKHFSKPKSNEKTMTLKQEKEPSKIHDFVSEQDAEQQGRGEEFKAYMTKLEADLPSMEEIMDVDDTTPDEISETPVIEETIKEVSTTPSSNLEDLFGVQFSPTNEEKTVTLEEEDNMEGSAAMNLPGADLFSGASLTNPSMIPDIEGKFE